MKSALAYLKNNKVRLSPSEAAVAGMLRDKPQSTEQLARKFFRKREQLPEHGRIMLAAITRRLESKSRCLPMQVQRTERCGPHPIHVWFGRKRAN